jgi:hypothetical protein
MPHRHGAAVGIHPVRPGIEFAAELQTQRGERFGELEDVDVRRPQTGPGDHLDDRPGTSTSR